MCVKLKSATGSRTHTQIITAIGPLPLVKCGRDDGFATVGPCRAGKRLKADGLCARRASLKLIIQKAVDTRILSACAIGHGPVYG